MSPLMRKALYPCEQVREFMYDYLEEKLPMVTSVRFHLHLNLCPPCREYLYLYRTAANAQAFRKENPVPDECLDSTLDFLKRAGIVSADAEDGDDLHDGRPATQGGPG